MFIEKIGIENFKPISKMELEFKKGINLLIGDNGTGKTSVLEAIVIALGGYLNGINGVSAKNVLLSDIKINTHNVGSISRSIEYCTPVKINCRLNINNQLYEWERIREDESSKRNTKTIRKFGDISKYARNLANDISKELPVLSYQSSIRVVRSKRINFGSEIKMRMDDRRCGYSGCLDAVLDLKRIKEWCYEMQRAEFDQDKKIAEYEQFKKIAGMVMQQMSGLEKTPQIYYSRQYKEIVYVQNDETLPVSCLSAGYQSVLWMVMDIAYRLAVLNPGKENLMECTGIVLIDEIDMHLHPKWQWNIIGVLENIFPQIQFIIATHSPIIIASCKAANLILIDLKQELNYLKDAYGYSVQDVLELCQGSSDVMQNIKKLRETFDMAMNDGDIQNTVAEWNL